jgi:hypothetical protein
MVEQSRSVRHHARIESPDRDTRPHRRVVRDVAQPAQGVLALQQASGNAAVVRLVQQSQGAQLVQREVSELKRPHWLPEVRATVKLKSGEHRRHVVMSSRMRQAIFAYHKAPAKGSELERQRHDALKQFVGRDGTVRTLMAAATEMVHNSMGNLYAGAGGENTAIGFSVEPLYRIADAVREQKTSENAVTRARKDLTEWAQRGIFGFAQQAKEDLAKVILQWAAKLDPQTDAPDKIADMIVSFGDSCSFDVPYERSENAAGVRDDDFPSHINKDDVAKLIAVATKLNLVIENPLGREDLYGDACLGYLKSVGSKYSR